MIDYFSFNVKISTKLAERFSNLNRIMQCVSLNKNTYISNLKILQQKCSEEWICLLLLQRSLKNKILIYHCILFKELQLAISNCSDFDFILDSERVVYLVMAVITKKVPSITIFSANYYVVIIRACVLLFFE